MLSWFGWKTPAEEARAYMLATGRDIPLECFNDDGMIDVDKLAAHVEADFLKKFRGIDQQKPT